MEVRQTLGGEGQVHVHMEEKQLIGVELLLILMDG